ncbi:Uma2 family endonuclease [Streptomyces sp. NPDC093109]|uniref:Uma2 family endonuclease n=1 Tax=Streptomyces sp. NPDC093109 TaxID=3154977 RepID=UPI00344FD54C
MEGINTAADRVEDSPRWPVPPPDGYTVDDLFTLPGLPRHTELIDGSLVFASPRRRFHTDMTDLLVTGLRRTAPPELKVRREMTVVIDRRNGPEPDVSVVRAKAVTSSDQTSYPAADVLLAVEVVSPDSEARDRTAKPLKYAAAGIPYFWLVEVAGSDKHPIVRTYELDPVSKSYVPIGIFHNQLKTSAPFTVDLDITLEALNRL